MQRLGVRPVTLSGTGNWVRGNLTWTSLPYQMNRLQIAADVHAWFGQFAALHRSAVSTYTPGDADWLFVASLNADGASALEAARQQPAFTRLHAVRQNHVATVDGQVWASGSGPLAAHQVLDDLQRILAP